MNFSGVIFGTSAGGALAPAANRLFYAAHTFQANGRSNLVNLSERKGKHHSVKVNAQFLALCVSTSSQHFSLTLVSAARILAAVAPIRLLQ
jgi:hypothetical protein